MYDSTVTWKKSELDKILSNLYCVKSINIFVINNLFYSKENENEWIPTFEIGKYKFYVDLLMFGVFKSME